MAILMVIPGLVRALYGRSWGERLLGLAAIPMFLVLYVLCAPLAIVLHLLNAAEEDRLRPD